MVALKETHTLIKAEAHAPIIAGNILALVKAREAGMANATGLKPYKKASDLIVVTNGVVSGTLCLCFSP